MQGWVACIDVTSLPDLAWVVRSGFSAFTFPGEMYDELLKVYTIAGRV